MIAAHPAVVVEGDSLAWNMKPALEHRLSVGSYVAFYGRPTWGIDKLTVRRVKGKILLVSLGTNDALLHAVDRRKIRYRMGRLRAAARCVVWSKVRITRPGFAADTRAVNSTLASVHGIHYVTPPPPDYGDGVHYAPRGARILADRFARTARRECGAR